MDAFEFLCDRAKVAQGYTLTRSSAATEDDIRACEISLGSQLPRSVRACLSASNGFQLANAEVSVLRAYSVAEIVSSTIENRSFWSRDNEPSPWGDFIEIAHSDNAESTYAIRPLNNSDESPVHEIWPEGVADWQTDPPLAASFGDWLVTIADALSSADPDRVYDTLWLGPAKSMDNS